MKFYILNDFDYTNEAHVVQQIGDSELCEYVHPDLWDEGEFQLSEESTPLEDFGFNITIEGEEAHFEKVRPSIAICRNGKDKPWRGRSKFTVRIPPYKRAGRTLKTTIDLVVPEWANWMATDVSGDTYFYACKPRIRHEKQSWDENWKIAYAYTKTPEADWENSLVKL